MPANAWHCIHSIYSATNKLLEKSSRFIIIFNLLIFIDTLVEQTVEKIVIILSDVFFLIVTYWNLSREQQIRILIMIYIFVYNNENSPTLILSQLFVFFPQVQFSVWCVNRQNSGNFWCLCLGRKTNLIFYYLMLITDQNCSWENSLMHP